MKIEALCSFSGTFTMAEGEVRECENEYILKDLLQAGYVKEAKSGKKANAVGDMEEETERLSKNGEPFEKKPRKRTVKRDEDK